MRKQTIKPETLRRYFRNHRIYFTSVPPESGRNYTANDYGQRREAEYPVALSVRHPMFNPRIRYQNVEMPAPVRLTSYAERLVERVA